jgi:hypothetical protein
MRIKTMKRYCCKCNKPLKTPESIKRGLGPVCYHSENMMNSKTDQGTLPFEDAEPKVITKK